MEKKIPPTNAYELMQCAIAHMKAHPEAYVQEYYLLTNPNMLAYRGRTCGSAYCRAGHIVMAFDGRLPTNYVIGERAAELLGFDMSELVWLFSGDACQFANGLYQDADPPYTQVTYQDNPTEYLRRGVRGMRLFMQWHKKRLVTHRLPLQKDSDAPSSN